MNKLVNRYVRAIMEQEAKPSIHDIDIRSDNLEDELLKLFSNIDNLEELGKELNYDASNLVADLKKLKHNDDMFHHGETVMDHTREVLEDLEEYIQDMDEDRKRVVRLAAALHDVGKAVAYKWDDKKNKPTFHGHAEESEKIAKHMLAKYSDESGELLQRILALVKEHDAFLHLIDQRGNSKSLKYLQKFVKKGVAVGDDLANLVAIAKADNVRAKSAEKDFNAIQGIMDDIPKYHEQEKEKVRQQELRKQKEQENIAKYKEEIIKIANFAIDGAGDAYPDMSAINKTLGMGKEYGAIKQIRALLER